jgi:hypothetical protein
VARAWIVGETRDQRVTIAPFPDSAHYATWEPHRATVETTDGRAASEPVGRRSFVGGQKSLTSRDQLAAVDYISAATWNCFAAPFIFARTDFASQEVEPRRQDGELWRRLQVIYPEPVATYCEQQTFSFDNNGLLRRTDYVDNLWDGKRAVQYLSG